MADKPVIKETIERSEAIKQALAQGLSDEHLTRKRACFAYSGLTCGLCQKRIFYGQHIRSRFSDQRIHYHVKCIDKVRNGDPV